MDGYAVRLADVIASGAILKIIGEAPAGTPFKGTVSSGEAVRIFTGGNVPSGADHIIIQEDTTHIHDHVTCNESYDTPAYIRAAGMDFKAGDTLVEAGTILGPAQLTIAASANIAELQAYRPLRVGLLANGNELKPPGSHLTPGQIPNANPIGLNALIRQWGGEPVDLGIAGDTLDAIAKHINAAEDIDLFVPIGGASVGDHDLMRPAFAAAGFAPVFEKVSVKPGKPTWYSTHDTAAVLGLPGNPASAFVCAHLFLRPLLMQHAQPSFVTAQLAGHISANGPRETYLRAKAHIDATGTLTVTPAPNQDSSLISPFLTCNALIRHLPHANDTRDGMPVDCLLIGPL
jgi:molybdopterin molybdotransferase